MKRALLKVLKYPVAAAALMLLVPAIPGQPLGGRVQAESSRPCYFYANYTVSGGSVVCYGDAGTACAVCAS
jgi:hypothetical protein